MITAERWYDQQPDLTLHYQGDVLRDIPFPGFPPVLPASKQEVWPLLRPMRLRGRTVEQAMAQLPTELMGHAAKDVPDRWSLESGEWAAAHFTNHFVMIVSRSCALDKPSKKHVLVAPVRSVESLPPDERRENKLRSLQNNEIPHWFYLPPKNGLTESYANLQLLTPIHRTFFPTEQIATNLIARLSSVGMMALQHVMSENFGIKFGFDHKDICRQSGRYACSNCFHAGMATEPQTKTADQPFGTCRQCDEDAAWVKLPI